MTQGLTESELVSMKSHKSSDNFTLVSMTESQGLTESYMSQCMRFPTMWYVQPAKPQISLHMHAV